VEVEEALISLQDLLVVILILKDLVYLLVT
jgi:hypothetical protein